MLSLKARLVAIRYFSLRAFFSWVLQAFGALWLLVEIGSFFSPVFAETVRTYWWLFAIAGALIGIWHAWPRLSVKSRVSGTDSSVEIRVCDLFSLPGALIVGSNTTFDTTLDDYTISERSVQGQFTKQYFSDVKVLDREISNSLEGTEFEELAPADKPYGKLQQYPLGTVAAVSFSGRRGYMLALATLNRHRVAEATRQDVLDALPSLWEFIRSRGGLDPLSCPILGSGFSRLNAQREDLVREIVKSFVAACQVGKFCEQLTVVVSPDDFWTGHINLETLGGFLEHECKYSNLGTQAAQAVLRGTQARPDGDGV